MTWFQDQRQKYIKERLEEFGFIRRTDLMTKFKISLPQASKDLQRFIKKFPGAMTYNLSTKRYEATNDGRREDRVQGPWDLSAARGEAGDDDEPEKP